MIRVATAVHLPLTWSITRAKPAHVRVNSPSAISVRGSKNILNRRRGLDRLKRDCECRDLDKATTPIFSLTHGKNFRSVRGSSLRSPGQARRIDAGCSWARLHSPHCSSSCSQCGNSHSCVKTCPVVAIDPAAASRVPHEMARSLSGFSPSADPMYWRRAIPIMHYEQKSASRFG